MTSIKIFEGNLVVESENPLDIPLKNTLWNALSILVKKMHLAAKDSHFQNNMCEFFGPSSKIRFLQERWIAKDFRILSGIYIIADRKIDDTSANQHSAFSQIRLNERFIRIYHNDINKLMSFILQALSYRISGQIFGGDNPEKDFLSFTNFVLSQESESLAKPSSVDSKEVSNDNPDNKIDEQISLEDAPEEITPSFFKVQGEFQWKDSCGNLHSLPID